MGLAQPCSLKPATAMTGTGLIEALVALLIVSFGMLVMIEVEAKLRSIADIAKQRGEAMHLAQQEMEQLRAYSVLALGANPLAGTWSYAEIHDPQAINHDAGDPDSNATFSLIRRVTDWSEPQQKAVRIEVHWHDRSGAEQFVVIDSLIARADPGLSGSLGIAPSSTALQGPAGRHPAIPLKAKDLGDRSSVFKPTSTAMVVWIFNNLTGNITGTCTVRKDMTTAALTAADLADCRNNTRAYLLSGFVRFSDQIAPDKSRNGSRVLPLAMALLLTRSGPQNLPNAECFDDSAQTAQGYVSYYCSVYPSSSEPQSWTGQLSVNGIALGGSDWKICRYSADQDGDGQIANAEHPLSYSQVTGSLANQNFLVIPAVTSCPTGQAINPQAGNFSNITTVLHQR